jgi:hypothetical protein
MQLGCFAYLRKPFCEKFVDRSYHKRGRLIAYRNPCAALAFNEHCESPTSATHVAFSIKRKVHVGRFTARLIPAQSSEEPLCGEFGLLRSLVGNSNRNTDPY